MQHSATIRTVISFLASASITLAASARDQASQETEESRALSCFVGIETAVGQIPSSSTTSSGLPLLSPKTPFSISIRIKNSSNEVFKGPLICSFELGPSDQPTEFFHYLSPVNIATGSPSDPNSKDPVSEPIVRLNPDEEITALLDPAKLLWHSGFAATASWHLFEMEINGPHRLKLVVETPKRITAGCIKPVKIAESKDLTVCSHGPAARVIAEGWVVASPNRRRQRPAPNVKRIEALAIISVYSLRGPQDRGYNVRQKPAAPNPR